MTAVLLGGAAMAIAPLASAAGPTWKSTPNGCGTSVTTGYVTGCNPNQGVFNDTGSVWSQVGSVTADFITEDDAGRPWVVGDKGIIYRWNPAMDAWDLIDQSKAWSTVAVGNLNNSFALWATTTSGQIWANDTELGGHSPNWTQIAGSGSKVALFQETVLCSNRGSIVSIQVPFVIDAYHNIFEYGFQNSGSCIAGSACNQGCFHQVSGAAVDISSDIVLGTDNNIYQWMNGTWDFLIGTTPLGYPTTHIGGVGQNPWAIDSHGFIYEVGPL
jgi:hypothetical protein